MTRLDQRLRDADPLGGRLPERLAFPFDASGEVLAVAYEGPRRHVRARWAGLAAAAAAAIVIAIIVTGVFRGARSEPQAVPARLASPTQAVQTLIAAWGRDDLHGVCATYSETQLAMLTHHGRSPCRAVLAAGGPEVDRDRGRFTKATAVEFLRAGDLAIVHVTAASGQTFDVPVLHENGSWRVGAYCEPQCSEHPPAQVKNGHVKINTTAVPPASPGSDSPGTRSPAKVPDDLPVQGLRGPGVGKVPPEMRNALAEADDAHLVRLLLNDGTATIAAAPTSNGLCFAARVGHGYGFSVTCATSADIRDAGSYGYSPCWHGDPDAIDVSGIVPDGVDSVALVRNGKAVKTAAVVNNAFHIEGRGDGIRIADRDDYLGPDPCGKHAPRRVVKMRG